MTDTSCSAERPPNSNATRSLSARWWSPESARWRGTSPKAAGLVNRPYGRVKARQRAGVEVTWGDAERCVNRDCTRRHRPRTGPERRGPLNEPRHTEVKTAGDWYYYLRQAG